MKHDYPVSVFPGGEDGGFVAIAPDLPGCSAVGETAAEALAEIEHAIDAWIEAAAGIGNPIPAPSRPAPQPSASGRLLLRLPKSLHHALIERAAREDVSVNQLLVYLLAERSAAMPVKTTAKTHVMPKRPVKASRAALQRKRA
jgi:predicted RNase H-like HicB family nuclease